MPADPSREHAPLPRAGRPLGTVLALLLAAVLAHAAALAAIQHLKGDFTFYAFQSPDAGEYVALGRGLAWQHRYVRIDPSGRPLSGSDTWRTPGFPLFLALVIRAAGDSPRILVLAQQAAAIVAVPLLWLVLRRLARPRWAFLASLAWCLDPFRLYYSLWLLSETFFTLILVLTCLVWLHLTGEHAPAVQSRAHGARSGLAGACALGLLTGFLVLIRPIAVPLPLLALLGVVLAASRPRAAEAPRNATRAWMSAGVACLFGVLLALAPWLLRNHRVAGHLALSQQSGASLAYHKVVDVVLWSQGRASHRFDPAAAAAIREAIDARLRDDYLERFGHLSPAEADSLRWQNLNFGKPLADAVDPFVVSGMLWSIGLDMLAQRPGFTAICFTVQGALMLVFPLGLVLWPPAGTGSAPFSMLWGQQGTRAGILSVAIGSAYAVLTLWILARLTAAVIRRRLPGGHFALWPAWTMFILSLPFEDPRFRLPLIPLFWILAVASPSAPSRIASPPITEHDPTPG